MSEKRFSGRFKPGKGKTNSPHFNNAWVPRRVVDVEHKPRLLRFTEAPEWMTKPLRPLEYRRTEE